MKDSHEFEVICKNAIINYYNNSAEITDNFKIGIKDVYVVWMCKTLQNSKALLSTNANDGMYYELTYNGDKKELYMDAYKKWQNIKLEEKNFDNVVHINELEGKDKE